MPSLSFRRPCPLRRKRARVPAFPASPGLAATLVAAAILLPWTAACGGGDDRPPPADDRPRPATRADSAAPTDLGPDGSVAPDTAIPPAGDSSDAGGDPGASDDGLPAWSPGPVAADGGAGAGGGQALLVASRIASHDGYDRFVLEFADRVPAYAVEYADGPLHQCGSGRPLDPGAPAALRIRLSSTVAHDEAGSPTVEERSLSPGLEAVRTARLTCDFEGEVEWLLGVASRRPLRVLSLESPARVVVDVRHP